MIVGRNVGEWAVEQAGERAMEERQQQKAHRVHRGRPQDTANKLRTAPLWGLRMRPRYMHDLKSLTLQNALERHEGEAEHVMRRFRELPSDDKEQLLSFLESL